MMTVGGLLRGVLVGVVAVTALTSLAGCARASGAAVATPGIVPAGSGWSSATDVRWLIDSGALTTLDGVANGAALATAAFDNPRTNVLGALPSDWSAARTTTFESYADFQARVSTLPPGSWVLYDNESWRYTPHDEQTDPGAYMADFVTLAHGHGLHAILAPALDITTAMSCRVAGEASWQNYVDSCRLPALAARARPDAYEIQSQSYETTTRTGESYADLVDEAAAQARVADSGLAVFAGLSTNPSGDTTITGATLYADSTATKDVVVGYWLNIPTRSAYCPRCQPGGDPQVAADYLTELGVTGQR